MNVSGWPDLSRAKLALELVKLIKNQENLIHFKVFAASLNVLVESFHFL